jgi:hypothetical protein
MSHRGWRERRLDRCAIRAYVFQTLRCKEMGRLAIGGVAVWVDAARVFPPRQGVVDPGNRHSRRTRPEGPFTRVSSRRERPGATTRTLSRVGSCKPHASKRGEDDETRSRTIHNEGV